MARLNQPAGAGDAVGIKDDIRRRPTESTALARNLFGLRTLASPIQARYERFLL